MGALVVAWCGCAITVGGTAGGTSQLAMCCLGRVLLARGGRNRRQSRAVLGDGLRTASQRSPRGETSRRHERVLSRWRQDWPSAREQLLVAAHSVPLAGYDYSGDPGGGLSNRRPRVRFPPGAFSESRLDRWVVGFAENNARSRSGRGGNGSGNTARAREVGLCLPRLGCQWRGRLRGARCPGQRFDGSG